MRKTFLQRRQIAFVVLIAVLLSVIVGVRYWQAKIRQHEISLMAVDWQKSGRGEVRRLISQAQATGAISDHDLDWSLAMMQRSPDAVVHARVLGLLEIVARSTQTPVTQKKKIATAIVPLLESQIPLDRLASVRVQRVLHGQRPLPFRPRG